MCSEGRVAAGAPVFPIGDLATGFFVIFALLAGVVGVSTSLTRRQRGVPRQHDVRRRLGHRRLDTHPPRHGFGVQGDQRQLEAREPGKNQLISRWSFSLFLLCFANSIVVADTLLPCTCSAPWRRSPSS